jgi:hypothetical protein
MVRKSIKAKGLYCIVFALTASLTLSSFAQQIQSSSGLRLYDSFDQHFINPAKWYTQWQCGSPAVMECEREIQDGQLHLRVRAYGSTTNNDGSQFGTSSIFLTSSSVTDIAAQAVIQETNAQGCPALTGAGTHGQALLAGSFFNGGGGTADDDVQAYLQFDRYSTDAPGVVLVGGFLKYQGQFFGNVTVGSVNVGDHVFVELKWDKANHRFVERLYKSSTNTWSEQSLPYTIPDSVPAIAPYKQLSANVFADNCVGTQTFADMGINFNNVMTN